MATKPTTQEAGLDLNGTDEKALFHDFVYRDDMSVNEIAEYLGADWDNAYDWLKSQLEQARDEDEE